MAPLGIMTLQVHPQTIEPAQRRFDDLGEMFGRIARRLQELQITKQGLYARVTRADVRLDRIQDDLTPHGAALILIPDAEMRINPRLQRIFLQESGAEGMNGRDGGIGQDQCTPDASRSLVYYLGAARRPVPAPLA